MNPFAASSANSVYTAVMKQAQPLVKEFEKRYKAWQSTWFAGANANSSKYVKFPSDKMPSV